MEKKLFKEIMKQDPDLVEHLVLQNLPHGSGIDYDWEIEVKPDRIVCDNAWHLMDEFGYYDCVLPFLNSYGHRKVRESGLRPYLEELFWEHGSHILNIINA
jgi:hypothetical protein